MTSQQILHADVLDILFEKRNKLYGAYQLRKLYPQRLITALGLSVSAVLLLLLFFRPSGEKSRTVFPNDGVVVTIVDALPLEPKKPEPPVLPKTENVPVKQQAFINQLKMVDKEIQTAIPPIDALENAAVSDKTMDGAITGAMQPPVPPVVAEAVSGQKGQEEAAQKEVIPDKQPQFPGGMQAWTAFLNRHLQAPQDLEPGEKRTVVVRFHVAEDGRVAHFQVLQSAGAAFDNEVIRVLKKMPAWTPAIKQGQPVPVSFTQPVTFVGVEE